MPSTTLIGVRDRCTVVPRRRCDEVTCRGVYSNRDHTKVEEIDWSIITFSSPCISVNCPVHMTMRFRLIHRVFDSANVSKWRRSARRLHYFVVCVN